MTSRLLAIALAFAGLSTPAATISAPLNGLPRLVLWAWERPADLRALDPDIGVAYLAQTITLQPHGMRVDRRRQPLQVAAQARVVAVTRIEAGPQWNPPGDRDLVRALAAQIAMTTSFSRVRAVQVDFDARESERDFYRATIRAVREAIGPQTPLSITALASWCAGDDWLGDLPIDEAVPMLFEMSATDRVFRDIAGSRAAPARACRGALGVAIDAPLEVRPSGRRVYVFNHDAWTAGSIAAARKMAQF
jgi:hypothetical protein